MTRSRVSARAWLLLAVGLGSAILAMASSYSKIATITGPNVPAPTWSFDISWSDEATRRYYLADRSNASVDIVNTATDTFVGQIGGFVGVGASNDVSGPNGIVVLDDPHELWAGDGDST